jgi:hypothetical protein
MRWFGEGILSDPETGERTRVITEKVPDPNGDPMGRVIAYHEPATPDQLALLRQRLSNAMVTASAAQTTVTSNGELWNAYRLSIKSMQAMFALVQDSQKSRLITSDDAALTLMKLRSIRRRIANAAQLSGDIEARTISGLNFRDLTEGE